MRGCGRSGGRRGHVDRFADFVDDAWQMNQIVRQAQPDGKIVLLGHSFGSLIALTCALQHPDGLSGVIVSGTALRDALPYPDWVRSLTGRLSRVLPTLAMPSGLKAEEISRDEAVVRAYRDDPLVHSVGTLRWAAEAIVARKWLIAHAGEWKLPLLMLHGGADRICLKEGALSFRDRAGSPVAYREYDGMYHEVHNDIGKEKVFQDIETWLKKTLQVY
jgi:alpha-beta hydrolase superfamily lysophospholipase